MKLVELLAKELSEWPEEATQASQDYDREIRFYDADEDQLSHLDFFVEDHADDACDAITFAGGGVRVTRAQWQAERDRQKGGEWKRHRGGKCPVPAGAKVSTRHRDGKVVDVHFHTATTNSGAATMNAIWKHTGDAHDIMSYKVISQPSSKAEARVPFGGDPIVEYAFGAPGEDMSSLDWKPLDHGRISDIEFDDVTTEEVEMIKVDPVVAANVEAFNRQWQIGRVDSPLVWRDTVTELNAYIEEFTRERDKLINRLASEGFALIPAMTAVIGVADYVDMSDWRNLKVGDIIECSEDGAWTSSWKGKHVTVVEVEPVDYDGDLPIRALDGDLDDWGRGYKFIRRP